MTDVRDVVVAAVVVVVVAQRRHAYSLLMLFGLTEGARASLFSTELARVREQRRSELNIILINPSSRLTTL